MKERQYYDYTCDKRIKESEVKKHIKKGCVVEGAPTEFFDEIEEEARNNGTLNE